MIQQKHIFIILLSIFLFTLESCYYKPFIGYTLNKKGFKNFSKSEKMAGNNSNPARDYEVNRYDWELEIFPETKRIEGTMDIHFTPQNTQNTFLFDLQKRMKITAYTCSKGTPKVKRKGDLLYLNFEENVPAQTRLTLSITYEGKPANVAGQGPIQWKEDEKGRAWISSITEGIGPQFMMPCNALLRAEADSVTISITVPSDLVVASNGRLTGVNETPEEKTKTYIHDITNPINIYNISFNVGHFVTIEKPYTDIDGIERILTFQVLDYHQDSASKFYDQTPIILKELEEMYGNFPFWEDGCKFIESTFSAMEHQSGIAMGSEYRNDWKKFNTTLIHELSHEWWGNSLTGKDYADVWMHEGLATYSEALFLERIYGPEAYNLRMKFAVRRAKNTIPILKASDVLYNSWVNAADQDIYSKGALTMHSLRKVVNNDSLFFNSLHKIQGDLVKQNVSSAELVSKLNTLLGKDYTSLFDWYLNQAKPPILEIYGDKEAGKMYFKWEKEIPFYNNGKVFIKQGEEILPLTPSTSYQSIKVPESASIEFLIENSIYYILDVKKKR